jgi:hypothetical protein
MLDDAGEDALVFVVVAGVVDVEEVIGESRLAARAAWVTGTWMPSDGRERDLRRVLYGMTADLRRFTETRPSFYALLSCNSV